MGGDSLSPKNDKISIKSRHSPSEKAFFELSDFDHKHSTTSENEKYAPSNADSQCSEILSTTDLISAVSYAWDRARQPLSVLLSKSHSTCKIEVIQGDDILNHTKRGIYHESTSSDGQPCSCHLTSKTSSTNPKEGNTQYLERDQDLSSTQPNYGSLSFWRVLHARSTLIDKSFIQCGISYTGIPSNFGGSYAWMSKVAPIKPKNEVECVMNVEKTTSNYDTDDRSTSPASLCIPVNSTNSCNNLTTGNSACSPEAAQPTELSCGLTESINLNASKTKCSENDHYIEATDNEIFTSISDGDYQETSLASRSDDCEIEDGLLDHQTGEGITFFKSGSPEDLEISLSEKEKPQQALAKREHAFAGAMAGISVSLCLHPLDTVKTIIQSCRADQKPLHYISRSIISERGLTGLYRGISSNIVTSAPISAVYTFTYESVKKNLLPHLSKENHSYAHCTAGGCASIATSFIFTPSERIKQQMQVRSHYRNCWNALIEVVQKGGLASLYAGWGAVLCRNVPHSVIKFYTYESLKPIMIPSVQSNAQSNTLMTLVCGGLAGSMASLFTTPFDVVKTRLQTQVPGSVTQYAGVFNTLAEIGKIEGLVGLYRGMTPRLVMYMIQGALFFASYESFKRLFSLDVPPLCPQTIQHEHKTGNDSTTLPSTSVTA